MEIIRGPIQSAQRVVIYGPEGIGKSTLASRLPEPVFIDTEGSTKQLDVARFPFPNSWAMLMSQVDYVRKNPGVCKTLVIDTADWAESLAKEAVCARANKDGIEDFGYGKGYVYLAEEFGKLLNALNDIIERGIHVVFTAHAMMRKFEQPDEAGSYDRWELKLEKKTAPMVKEWADIVLFVNYKTYVVKDGDRDRYIAQGGKRVMYTTHHPAWDAKNRHNLPEELPLDYAAIAHIFEGGSPAPTEPAPAQTAPLTTPEPARQVAAPESTPTRSEPESTPDAKPDLEPAPQEQPAAASSVEDFEAEGVPKALADLMQSHGVTLEEIQAVVAARGYFPKDTPFRNYPKDFVDGVLIAAWPQVFKAIEETRELNNLPF